MTLRETKTQPLMVTKKEAAALLALSEREVIRLVNDGELERRWVGTGTKYWRITYDSMLAYVAALPEERQPKD